MLSEHSPPDDRHCHSRFTGKSETQTRVKTIVTMPNTQGTAREPFGVTILLFLIAGQLTISSAFVKIACVGDSSGVTLECEQNEIIHILRTVLTYQASVPGVDTTCEDVDFENNCHAYTNVSDNQFVGRQSYSYPIRAEDLATHPERQGDCENAVRSNWVKVYYECISTESSRLQSVCSDILWENEFDGFITTPYFPKTFPADSETVLNCECFLRPDDNSEIELIALLINPSSGGITWSLQMDTGSGYSQDLAGQFLASRIIPLQYNSGVITLKFTSIGSGTQQPSQTGPPAGFWLQYKAFLKSSAIQNNPNQNTPYPNNLNQNTPYTNNPNQNTPYPNQNMGGQYYGPVRRAPGRVTLYCNDPNRIILSGGAIAGIVIGVIVIILLVVAIVWFVLKRKRGSGKTYKADKPHVYSGKTNKAMAQESQKKQPVEEETEAPVYNPYHTPRQRVSAEEYSEMPQYGRGGRNRTYSNNSSNDKVFLDDVEKKSLPSSGRTGDNDSIAKKSLSDYSHSDDYSDVNYPPKAVRLSTSLGRDTAV